MYLSACSPHYQESIIKSDCRHLWHRGEGRPRRSRPPQVSKLMGELCSHSYSILLIEFYHDRLLCVPSYSARPMANPVEAHPCLTPAKVASIGPSSTLIGSDGSLKCSEEAPWMATLSQLLGEGKAWYRAVIAEMNKLKEDRDTAHTSIQGILENLTLFALYCRFCLTYVSFQNVRSF